MQRWYVEVNWLALLLIILFWLGILNGFYQCGIMVARMP